MKRLLSEYYQPTEEDIKQLWQSPYMQDFTGERGEGRREGVSEASADGTDPIDMTKFRKRIGAEGAELRREDFQDVLVICITSEVRASDDPELFEKDTE